MSDVIGFGPRRFDASRAVTLIVVALIVATSTREQAAAQATSRAAPAASDAAIETVRTRFAEAKAARAASKPDVARAKLEEALETFIGDGGAAATDVTLLFDLGRFAFIVKEPRLAKRAFQHFLDVRPSGLPDSDRQVQVARTNLALALFHLGDPTGARTIQEQVLAIDVASLPNDDPNLQRSRTNLAVTLLELNEFSAARVLQEQVLAVESASLPDDHPDLQTSRGNLALTLRELRDFEGARVLQEKVVDVLTHSVPEDDEVLQRARVNLAGTCFRLEDYRKARALLEPAVAAYSRTLGDDDRGSLRARSLLALTIEALGDLRGARDLKRQVLAGYERALGPDHLLVQVERQHLAATLVACGEIDEACELFGQAVETLARNLPDDDPDLQDARSNLAGGLFERGDLIAARTLLEKVLANRPRSWSEDSSSVQGAKANLAATLEALGDLSGARVLFEQVLAANSRTRSEDNARLQEARTNLAATLMALNDPAGARALFERVLEVRSRTLPESHPDLHTTRMNLAVTLRALGELERAASLQQSALDRLSALLPETHPSLQLARANLALTLGGLGEIGAARVLEEQVVAARAKSLSADHRDSRDGKKRLAVTIAAQAALADARVDGARDEARARCQSLIRDFAASSVRAVRTAAVSVSSREAEETCADICSGLETVLSFARGYGVFESAPDLDALGFVLSETSRGAALTAAGLARRTARSPRAKMLRESLARATATLAELARVGTTGDSFDSARTQRDAAERALIEEAREASGPSLGVVTFDVAPLACALGPGAASIAYRTFVETRFDRVGDGGAAKLSEVRTPRLCAFVVRGATSAPAESSPAVTFVDLGPMLEVERAVMLRHELTMDGASRGNSVESTRVDLEHVSGERLRALIFDPLLPALGEARHLVVVPDDVLHLVPLDALPLSEGVGVLGDRFRIDIRATLTELLDTQTSPSSGELLALGGAAFDSEPIEPSADERIAPAPSTSSPRTSTTASILRGGVFERGFDALPHTALEVEGIGALYAGVSGDKNASLVLEHAKASRATLNELAPRARFLHVATHGWYAPESIRSFDDPTPIDARAGLGLRMSGEEAIRTMSPMLLCGLALAGANLPEDAAGRAPGLVTAEEISTLDLTNCELAVLSACETNVGVQRAGQGVASLQRALQMAGARSVITSLWKVPDAPTKDLMLEFYRRLWVERQPKWQALWEAKRMLRDARDERGKPRHTTKDWGAWVLTGDPD